MWQILLLMPTQPFFYKGDAQAWLCNEGRKVTGRGGAMKALLQFHWLPMVHSVLCYNPLPGWTQASISLYCMSTWCSWFSLLFSFLIGRFFLTFILGISPWKQGAAICLSWHRLRLLSSLSVALWLHVTSKLCGDTLPACDPMRAPS